MVDEITKNGQSKKKEWKHDNKERIFLPEKEEERGEVKIEGV